jgi:hypothetical protein
MAPERGGPWPGSRTKAEKSATVGCVVLSFSSQKIGLMSWQRFDAPPHTHRLSPVHKAINLIILNLRTNHDEIDLYAATGLSMQIGSAEEPSCCTRLTGTNDTALRLPPAVDDRCRAFYGPHPMPSTRTAIAARLSRYAKICRFMRLAVHSFSILVASVVFNCEVQLIMASQQ